MEEVRQLVQEEGREARNLVAFHVAVDSPARVSRKPPRAVGPLARRAVPRPAHRSASAGRDKRSELRARYWALLFGDLQRSIGEIYNTVEAHENLNECQEVILVLENYTRDFKALCEWFRLKWEYDNTPPLQRPQSLAWEIRKTDFVRPESRKTYSVKSSPSVSGKNSPCLSGHNTPSGKNSPSLTGKASPSSGKISPRVALGSSSTSPKASVEFFSTKIASKVSSKPEPKSVKEGPKLFDIKEKVVESPEDVVKEMLKTHVKDDKADAKSALVQKDKAKERSNANPKQVVVKSKQKVNKEAINKDLGQEISSQAKATIAKLDEMENEFLSKNRTENAAKNDNLINTDKELEIDTSDKTGLKTDLNGKIVNDEDCSSESPTKSEDHFGDVSNDSSPKSGEEKQNANEISNTDVDQDIHTDNKTPESIEATIKRSNDTTVEKDVNKDHAIPINKITEIAKENKDPEVKKAESKPNLEVKPSPRPAYSQAAAKPKSVTPKTDVKTPVRTATPLARSKTVVEMRPNTVPKTQKQFPIKNQTNKCSYPFNLTTGRTSLFDANQSASKGAVPKKPANRNSNMASGDAKVGQNKTDSNKRPPRPTSLDINDRGDKVDKANPSLEKIKDCEEYSSSDTIVTQVDMSRIESSESLKTLVPEDLLFMEDVANSIEVLNVDNNKSDNEGWLTVKSRRVSRESKKQKSHWANRFHQPSATTSLPTLNMIESPKQELKPIVEPKPTTTDRAKSEQPDVKPEKPVKVVLTKQSKNKDAAIIRQKSDVTGLKTRSSKSKALNKKSKDKNKENHGSELTKNRLHSSLESLTTGLERSQESTEETFDFDTWRAESKSTFKYLDDDDQIEEQSEFLKTADPTEVSEIAEMTSQIEENERKISWALDFQAEVDQRKLCEEEDLLNRQIMELQQVSDIDIDTETDDTETDAEILIDEVQECSPATLGPLAACLEERYESELAGMSWAERVHTLTALQALVARDPGRAQQLHAKLSQGIKRRGSIQDALRRLQTKQARAERQRQEYQTERAKKIHLLLAKVEEVKVAKNQLIEEKRLRMERRLQKAAENRDQHLKDIVRKAHDEEEKLREIAFIKQLEAENRRHDFLEQCRSLTTRLKEMRKERLDKLEQKAVREAGVVRRRRALELARALHVRALLERGQQQRARLDLLRQRRLQERGHANREKAEGVKSRQWALAQAASQEAEALRSRIRCKQHASHQRLQSHLQHIREKATGPRQPTLSDSQDQSTKEIEEEAVRIEQERREKERLRAVKKKSRKIKQKLLVNSTDITTTEESQSPTDTFSNPSLSKANKVLNQINNIIAPLIEVEKAEKVKATKNGPAKESQTKELTVNIETTGKENGEGQGRKQSADLTTDLQQEIYEITNGINNNKKKSKKKNKEYNESNDGSRSDRKLSKTSSLCSSVSDMSKTSLKLERKAKIDVDLPYLERQLNELHRAMEKIEKSSSERVVQQKLQGVKTLGLLLAIAADKEDITTQFSIKSLTTAVTTLSTAAASCVRCATHVLRSTCCVHVATLLAACLEKDLQPETKETELARQLCDCLSLTLEAVVCATREAPGAGKGDAEGRALAEVRSRAHGVVSYLCLNGSITRAEFAGDARDNVQTLLTVCAQLCQPSPLDSGSERLLAVQSLRSALGTSLCGFRSEFCVQWADATPECGGVARAALTAGLLRALAELNPQIVQEAFGEAGWPLEFRAAVARLLTQHAPSDGDSPRSTTRNQRMDEALSEVMVLDLIVLVGFVVVNNHQLQETICTNWSVIKTLCTLPANWLVSARHSAALLPTLLALAQHPPTGHAIHSQLSQQMLEDYLKSSEAQKVKLIQVIRQSKTNKTSKKT